jgi:hypothetical protein
MANAKSQDRGLRESAEHKELADMITRAECGKRWKVAGDKWDTMNAAWVLFNKELRVEHMAEMERWKKEHALAKATGRAAGWPKPEPETIT